MKPAFAAGFFWARYGCTIAAPKVDSLAEMARKSKAARQDDDNPVLLKAMVAVGALVISSHVSFWAWAGTLIVVSWLASRYITAAWWLARRRAFGRELEARSLADLGRVARLLRVVVDANVVVPGLGDADAIVGRSRVLIEIKSFRRWDTGEERCIGTIKQVQQLMERLKLKRAIIWLPQAKLTFMQRIGLADSLPAGVTLAAGPAWRPLLRAVFR